MGALLTALSGVFALYLHVLDRSGGAARLAALALPVPSGARPFWAVVAVAAAVLLLYGALSVGTDARLLTFRALCLLAGGIAPLLAARVGEGAHPALGGGLLALLLLAGLLHRALAPLRRTGAAERGILWVRGGCEAAGLALLALSGALLALERPVPLRLAFWALFLLRLSIADLVDPSALASELGLTGSATKDLKAAVGATKGRRAPPPSRRLVRAFKGLGKTALLLLWLALPLAASLAPGEVAAGSWPDEALALHLYPPLALGLTALVLLVRGLRDLRRQPVAAVRALVAGAGTGLYLLAVYRDPSFAAYRASLAGLVLAETVFAFLLGAASRAR